MAPPNNNNLIGLPEHNVVLEGDVNSPVLVNNTGRGIIAGGGIKPH